MSSSDSLQDNEPPTKKQRVDSDEDQDVATATGTVHDRNMTSLGQSEVEKTVASPGTYNFTIANGKKVYQIRRGDRDNIGIISNISP